MSESQTLQGPAVEPVLVAEALARTRLDAANGPLLEPLLREARERAEHLTGRSLITQNRVLRLSCWPMRAVVRLDKLPVQAVLAVRYWADGAWQTLPDTSYTLERLDDVNHVLMPVASWPGLGARNGHRVEVQYRAGYGDDGQAVPAGLREWIISTAAHNLMNPAGETAPSEHLDRRLDGYRTRI